MSVVLSILLIAFCIQGLVKFAVGFVVPCPIRSRRVASYYQRGGRIISIYDTATLITVVALIVLLAGQCLVKQSREQGYGRSSV
ncbi:MAG TPA: hypothetical protein VER34_25525 [Mycobacterium sp.]|jgi:hypothetical protein|nr:hypothetical protein [Mycobacterium sp.]